MRTHKLLSVFFITATLSGCQATTSQIEWTQIDRTTSRISVAGDDSMITSREGAHTSRQGIQMYGERLNLRNGTIFFEEMISNHAEYSYDGSRDVILKEVAPLLKQQGIEVAANDIKKANFQESEIFFVAKSSPGRTCMGFTSYFGHSGGTGWGTKNVGGIACEGAHVTAAKLEADMLDLLARLRFDGGQLNRLKASY